MAAQKLERSEFGAAARVLARAFAGDPVLGHFLNDPRRRRLVLPQFFRTVLEELAPAGELYGIDQAAVAVWLPPGGASTRTVRARLHSTATRVLFPRAAPLLRAGFDLAAAHHPAEPHWYLAFVGVDPVEQGRGLGRTLLTAVHDRADRGRIACYLETPFPETHAFYRGLGYELVDELRPFVGGPPIWTMLRRPR